MQFHDVHVLKTFIWRFVIQRFFVKRCEYEHQVMIWCMCGSTCALHNRSCLSVKFSSFDFTWFIVLNIQILQQKVICSVCAFISHLLTGHFYPVRHRCSPCHFPNVHDMNFQSLSNFKAYFVILCFCSGFADFGCIDMHKNCFGNACGDAWHVCFPSLFLSQ